MSAHCPDGIMDFGCALGELDDIWALPEESMELSPSYSPERLLLTNKAATKLKTQELPELSFEFTIPRIPSPDYDIQQQLQIQLQQDEADSSIQEQLKLDSHTWRILGGSMDESIDGSRHSNDTIDTSLDESTDTFHGYGLESPHFENGDHGDDILSQSHYLEPVLAPRSSSLIEQNTGSMLQLPPQEQQLLCQEGLVLDHDQGADALILHDPNPHYVRTYPIPPQQQQNWRSFARRQSISKMPLAQLYQIMGLPHSHSSAKDREERIMSELQKSGFKIGQQTWIRDTEEPFRRNVIDRIYQQTKDEYGYSKNLLEAIIRRGTYARMQSNLRRKRRHMSRMRRRGLMN